MILKKDKGFCDNCGLELDKKTKLCPNCDKDLYEKFSTQHSFTKILLNSLFYTVILIGIILIGSSISRTVEYRETFEIVMDAYLSNDIDTLVSNSSFLYSNKEDNLKKQLTDQIGDLAEKVNNAIGEKGYNLTYNKKKATRLSTKQFQELLKTSLKKFNGNLMIELIEEMYQIEVDVNASKGMKSGTFKIMVYLTKEDEKWHLFYIDTNN